MANYNRSQSQKILFVVSIINIVAGAFALLAALLSLVGFAALGASTAADLQASGVSVQDASLAGGALTIIGIVALFSGVISVVEGILGIRAANDNQKIMPVWVLALISMALYIFSTISSIVNGTFSVSTLVGLVIAGLMFYVANTIKQEAGK